MLKIMCGGAEHANRNSAYSTFGVLAHQTMEIVLSEIYVGSITWKLPKILSWNPLQMHSILPRQMSFVEFISAQIISLYPTSDTTVAFSSANGTNKDPCKIKCRNKQQYIKFTNFTSMYSPWNHIKHFRPTLRGYALNSLTGAQVTRTCLLSVLPH